jgi:hypothetical protein
MLGVKAKVRVSHHGSLRHLHNTKEHMPYHPPSGNSYYGTNAATSRQLNHTRCVVFSISNMEA